MGQAHLLNLGPGPKSWVLPGKFFLIGVAWVAFGIVHLLRPGQSGSVTPVLLTSIVTGGFLLFFGGLARQWPQISARTRDVALLLAGAVLLGSALAGRVTVVPYGFYALLFVSVAIAWSSVAVTALVVVVVGSFVGFLTWQADASAGAERFFWLAFGGATSIAFAVLRNFEDKIRNRASDDLRRKLVDVALDCVVVMSARGIILDFNRAAERTFGHSRGDVVGKILGDVLIPPHLRDAHRESLRRWQDTGRPTILGKRIEIEALRCDGTIFPVELAVDLVEGSQPPVFVGFIRDLTERKEAEAQREAFEIRLRQAEKFESLGMLASGIAHDFNNLLVGIAGNVEFARRRLAPDSPLALRLERIDNASSRAAGLTQQLLAYAGKATLKETTVDLADIAAEAAQLVASGTRGDIETEAAVTPAWISADATQLSQVAMNLLTNACEAAEDGGGHVRVRTGVFQAGREYLAGCHPARSGGPGEYAFLEVEDDGPGMDRDTRARIFEPFFSSHGMGRGLGLAMVIGIVDSHRGTTHVASEPGQGTRFRVLFPRVPEGEPSPAPTHDLPRPAEAPIGGGLVLVVDDEAPVRAFARECLELDGHEVVEAARGADAIELFRRSPQAFAAALLDVSMPGMDGPETLAALREIRDDVPVVFMSGHGAAEAGGLLAGPGPSAHMRKPFRIEDLQNAVRSAIREGRSPADL